MEERVANINTSISHHVEVGYDWLPNFWLILDTIVKSLFTWQSQLFIYFEGFS